MILDAKQIVIKERLDSLTASLAKEISQSFLQRLLTSQSKIKSLYIHGDVGRGKSMLMKKFFNSLDNLPKTPSRVEFHFNAFMQEMHETLFNIRQEKKSVPDELIEAVKRVIKNNKVICFDEFQVTDIADAMLLSRIFSYLFENNFIVVFTSNSKPSDLYKNGLQREIFLEFVNHILLKNCDVLHLDSATDYRSQYCQSITQRFFIESDESNSEINKIINNLTGDKPLKPSSVKVWGREIKLKNTSDKIMVVNFDEICQNSLSASDFRAICKNFNLIFLMQIPKLLPEDVNEAKRFMLFIDEVYENKVALITSSKTSAENIYKNGTGSEAFTRSVSRLNEIKSDYYWQMSKIN